MVKSLTVFPACSMKNWYLGPFGVDIYTNLICYSSRWQMKTDLEIQIFRHRKIQSTLFVTSGTSRRRSESCSNQKRLWMRGQTQANQRTELGRLVPTPSMLRWLLIFSCKMPLWKSKRNLKRQRAQRNGCAEAQCSLLRFVQDHNNQRCSSQEET